MVCGWKASTRSMRLVVAPGAVERLLERVGAEEGDDSAPRGFRPAAVEQRARAARPVHLPMQLQPSTQSWRVICVRDGRARSSASDSCIGLSTRPPTSSRQSAKSARRAATIVGIVGIDRAVGLEIRRDVAPADIRAPAPGAARAGRAGPRGSALSAVVEHRQHAGRARRRGRSRRATARRPPRGSSAAIRGG